MSPAPAAPEAQARAGAPQKPPINSHREGAGPPLVLIHGIGLRWQIWRPVMGRLAADFEVIACDSPGFGQSPALADGVSPTIPAYAAAYERFFAAEGLSGPHVVGNSMGGAIALELARRGVVATATAISRLASGRGRSGASAKPRWRRSRRRRARRAPRLKC